MKAADFKWFHISLEIFGFDNFLDDFQHVHRKRKPIKKQKFNNVSTAH